jgi:hypothetical protein
MGVTTHLQLHRKPPIELSDARARILFERKTFIPFGWFLFFGRDDISVLDDASTYLAVGARAGVARARRRVKAISAVGTERLVGGLSAYLDAIEKAGDGILVLDPHRVGATKKELQQRLDWLDALAAKPTVRALKKGEALFADDDEGPLWEDPDGNRAMDCHALDDVIGWSIRAPKVKWKHPETPEPEVDPAELEATRARLEAQRLAHEAARRPVSDAEFAAALSSGDDGLVRELFSRQQRADEPGRLDALIAAAFAAGRFTTLTRFFADLSTARQTVVAYARFDAALVRHESMRDLLVDLDNSQDNRNLMVSFARRVFESWTDKTDVANALSPVLYALPSTLFGVDEWEQLARGAEKTGNEALIWRCREHARAAR